MNLAKIRKKITPHKLRSTFGTNLYRETQDIYMVADFLGHSDINTTKKHYAAIGEDIKREALDKVGYFDERIKYAEDNDMWFRVIALYPVAFYDKYMAFYQFDAENRALNKPITLKYFLPYYVDKYRDFKDNQTFYTWINRWAANHIRKYYFEEIAGQRLDANVAAKKLDYSVIPTKYRFLYGMPYSIACVLNKFDKWYHKR